MKGIYKFHCDCGRMGEVSGIFVANSDAVKNAIGCELYFGEILGKHSEIEGTLDEDEVSLVTDDQDFVRKFEELKCENGYNPLSYLKEFECKECWEVCGRGKDPRNDDGICEKCAEKKGQP